MADDKRTCPECGAEIPAESESGVCPRCALDLALDARISVDASSGNTGRGAGEELPLDSRGASSNEISDETVRETVAGESNDNSGRGSRRSESDHGRRRFARLLAVAMVIALASYGVSRMYFVSTHRLQLLESEGPNAGRFYFEEYYGDQLDPDERITHINGKSLEGADVLAILQDALEADRAVFTVANVDGSREVEVPSIVWRVQWARLGAGLAFACLGAIVYWLRPYGQSSLGFSAFCFFVGALWSVRAIPFFERVAVELVAYHFLQVFLPAATMVLMVTFTPLRRVFTKPMFAVGLCSAACATLMLSNYLAAPESTAIGALSRQLAQIWALLLLGIILITLPHGLWAKLSGVSLTPTDRQRGSILRIAILLSFVPPLVFLILGRYLGLPIHQDVLSELTVLLFPIIVGYAIVRHNLLSVSALMLEGTLYGLVITGMLFAYAMLVSAASTLMPDQQEVAQASLAGLAAVAAVPIHARVRRFAQMRLNRVPFDYEALVDVLDDLAKKHASLTDYCEAVASRLSRAANTEDVSLILRKPGEHGITLLEHTPREHPESLVYDCQLLIEDLQEGASEISIDDLMDEGSSGRGQSSTFNVLKALRANIVFPLTSQGQLIGALALGARVDSRNYSAGEITTFRRIARQLATTLIQMISRMAALSGARIADMYPACPQRIGRYHIDRPLGEGGTAYVFRGRSAEGWAALKICNRNVQASRRLMERFHREAKAMQVLDHPNIMRVLEVGWEGPEPYIAMECFSAGSVEDLVESQGRLSESEALEYTRQVASGLQAALLKGIIHRDIKPRNLFLGEGNQVKIGDFGFAQIADESTLTLEGEIFGTPHYISPEVLEGGEADWRADQYALGVTLYFMLTGRRPFAASKLEALYQKYLMQSIPDVRDLAPDTSEACATLLRRMVTRNREERCGSYKEVDERIRGVIEKLGDPR